MYFKIACSKTKFLLLSKAWVPRQTNNSFADNYITVVYLVREEWQDRATL